MMDDEDDLQDFYEKPRYQTPTERRPISSNRRRNLDDDLDSDSDDGYADSARILVSSSDEE